jgi:bromodomain-containing factor 1
MVNKVGTNVETPKSPIKRIIVTTSRAKNQSPSKRSVAVSKKNTKKFKKSISKPEGTLSDRMTLVLNEMCNHPHAFWFLDPVDPVALGIPSYPEIVREPMDLSTIRSLLNGGSFENDPVEFGRLLDLIFTNSTLFNPPSTLVHQNSLEMRRDAAKILKRLIPEAITNTVSSKEL